MTYRIPPRIALVDDAVSEMTWVLPVGSSRIQGLTPVATLIWAACDGAESEADIVRRLVEAHGWDGDEIAPHVSDFVAQLVQMQLLEESS